MLELLRQPSSLCNQCSFVAKKTGSLREHVEAKHSDGAKDQCDECGKQFSFKGILERHINAMHRAAKYSCPLCDHVAARSDFLKYHVL